VTHFFDLMNLVDRFAVTREMDRSAVARENDSPAGTRWAALFLARIFPHLKRME
jgi:hypothetical protein